MNTTRIQAVFFDLGHTLLHPVKVGKVYADIGRKYGTSHHEDLLQARFIRAFKRQEELDRQLEWRTGEERERERWRTIVAETLDDVSDFEACFADLYAFYAKPEAWRLDDGAAALIETLRARGIRFGIASNYDQRLFDLVRAIPLLAPISTIVVSACVGYRKPAPQFYDAVIRAARAPAAQILMVGDDPVADAAGARACGLQAALVGKGAAALRLCEVADLIATGVDR